MCKLDFIEQTAKDYDIPKFIVRLYYERYYLQSHAKFYKELEEFIKAEKSEK